MNRVKPLPLALFVALAIAATEVFSESPISLLAVLALGVAIVSIRHRLWPYVVISALMSGHALWDQSRDLAASRELWRQGRARVFAGVIDGPIAVGHKSVRFPLSTDTARIRVIVRRTEQTERLEAGDEVSVWGHLGVGPTYFTPGAAATGFLALRSNGVVGQIFANADSIEVRGSVRAPSRLFGRLQRAASNRVAARGGDVAGNAIVRAIVAGDRQAIDAELSSSLRRSGIAHLLAVSGLHIAVVALFAFAVTRRLWVLLPRLSAKIESRTVAAIAGLAIAAVYAFVTGGRPSAIRALVVAMFAFWGLGTFRRARAPDCLGVAIIVLLGFEPAMLFDPSFQMSASAAVILVIAFSRRERGRGGGFARVVRAAKDLALVATLALAATAPASIPLYGELPLVGIALNIIAVPVIEFVVLPLGLLGVAASQISPSVGGVLIDAAVWAAGVVAALASLVADHCEPLDASLSPVSVTCLFAVAIGLVACVRRVTKFRAAFLAASLLAAFVAMTSANQRTVPTGLVVSFLDVGQGDAAVVEFPTGEVWLVDAGGRPFSRDPEAVSSPGLRSVVPFLRHRRIRRIDAVVLSHAHPDHYAGLAAIATRMPIGTVFVATDDIDQPRPRSLRLLLSQLEFLGTEVTDPPVYMSIGDARAAFLAPTYLGRVGVDPVSGVNDNSIAMRIEYGGRSILFAGDLEGEGEDLLVEAKRDQLDVDIAKVNHHGSKTSSSAEWVDATSARYAVISCGRGNRFGFPDSGVLARWRESGARVLRTDLSGTITFRIDRAGDIGVETFVALPR